MLENKTKIYSQDFIKFEAEIIINKYSFGSIPIIKDNKHSEFNLSNCHYPVSTQDLIQDYFSDFKQLFSILRLPSNVKYDAYLKKVQEGGHPPHTDSDNGLRKNGTVITRCNICCSNGSDTIYYNKNLPTNDFYIKKTHNLFHLVDFDKMINIPMLYNIENNKREYTTSDFDFDLTDHCGNDKELAGLKTFKILPFIHGNCHLFPCNNLHGSFAHKKKQYKYMLTGVFYLGR